MPPASRSWEKHQAYSLRSLKPWRYSAGKTSVVLCQKLLYLRGTYPLIKNALQLAMRDRRPLPYIGFSLVPIVLCKVSLQLLIGIALYEVPPTALTILVCSLRRQDRFTGLR